MQTSFWSPFYLNALNNKSPDPGDSIIGIRAQLKCWLEFFNALDNALSMPFVTNASIWEKAIPILAELLNSSRSYLITAVCFAQSLLACTVKIKSIITMHTSVEKIGRIMMWIALFLGMYVSMTSLFAHKIAQPTKWRFCPRIWAS